MLSIILKNKTKNIILKTVFIYKNSVIRPCNLISLQNDFSFKIEDQDGGQNVQRLKLKYLHTN